MSTRIRYGKPLENKRKESTKIAVSLMEKGTKMKTTVPLDSLSTDDAQS